jgi:HNH endonuclease
MSMKRIEITTAYLLSKVMPVTESGCWIWMGEITKSHGYGVVNGQLPNGRRIDYVHRIFYERFKGAIPKGFTIDHLCRVRCCANPDHLEPVTIGENVLRGNSTSANHSRKTHCIHGHSLSGDNLYFVRTRPNTRICQTCMTKRRKEVYARKRLTMSTLLRATN